MANAGWNNIKKYRDMISQEVKEKYEKNPKLCKTCGKTIPYEKRWNSYCNSSCFAKTSNKGICRNGFYYQKLREQGKFKSGYLKIKESKYIKPLPTRCLFCGKVTENRNSFCSKQCIHLYKTQNLIELGKATFANRLRIKHYLIYMRGHKCEMCKTETWIVDEKKHDIPLEMHHIDGDVLNMKLDNLLLVCHNCHSFTPTFKSKNRHKNTNRAVSGKTNH